MEQYSNMLGLSHNELCHAGSSSGKGQGRLFVVRQPVGLRACVWDHRHGGCRDAATRTLVIR